MQRLPRLVELLLVIALCGLVAWWVTRVMRGTPIDAPPPAGAAVGGANSRVDAALASARLFGSRPPGVLSDNVRPLGVVADESGRGSVIVSIDGQPAKVYRVGDTLDGRLVSAIRSDEIELESGGARQVFRLPPPLPTPPGLTVLGTGTALPSADGSTPPQMPVSAAQPARPVAGRVAGVPPMHTSGARTMAPPPPAGR